jgi:hypothetical protein
MITDRPNNGATETSKSAGRMPGSESTSASSSDGESKMSQLGHMAQEKLSDAATYVKDRGVSGLKSDLTDVATRNPLGAIAVSVCVGYVLGRIMSRG